MAITTYTLPAITNYKFADNRIGYPELSGIYVAGSIGAPGVTPLPSTVIASQLMTLAQGTSYDSTFGGMGTFIFLAVPTSTTTTQGLLYTWKGDGTIVVVPTSVASNAVSGLPLALAINSVTSNASSVQYTWFQVQGRGCALKSVSITAQPSVALFVSGATAGRVRTTGSIFRTIIGIRSANTATATGSILPVYLNFPSVGPGV